MTELAWRHGVSFTEALAVELEQTGITVTALCPGATDTDFFPKAGMTNAKVFQKGNVMAPAKVAEIAGHVRDAISHTRSLARGLSPVTIESEGLMSALLELATNTEKIFQIQCRCDFDEPVAIHDHAVATHMFRIAQEAVSNAIKHGRARKIVITLKNLPGRIRLNISDNGTGLKKQSPNHKGMGLRIMQSRASMIGGSMAIDSKPEGGVSVTCAVPEDRVLAKPTNSHARKI